MAKILENRSSYSCSWAGTFQMKLQIHCTVFQILLFYLQGKGILKNIRYKS